MATTIQSSVDVNQPAAGNGEAVVWAMPLLIRDPNSVWARSLGLRDTIYDAVEETCQTLRTAALVNKSIDFVYPAWVSIEAWMPAGAPGATHRLFCTFSIEPKPYSRFEFEVSIRVERDGKKKEYGPFQALGPNEVSGWVRYFFDKAARPDTSRGRIQKFGWQFWYPKNKVSRLGRDLLAVAAVIGFVVVVVFASTA